MKRIATATALLCLLMVITTGNTIAMTTEKALYGTWHYSVVNAPYGYESGDLVLKKEGGEITGSLIFAEGYSVSLYEIKIKKGQLSFKAFVEGSEISFEGTYTKKKIEGTVTYVEGTLALTAVPKTGK